MQASRRHSNVALTGLKHVGKSSVGSALARAASFEFVDTDAEVARIAVERGIAPGHIGDHPHPTAYQSAVRHTYRKLGPLGFADLELEALRRHFSNRNLVVATGGGIADSEASMDLLSAHWTVVYLSNDPAILYERVARNGTPAFLDPDRPREHFIELCGRRHATYRKRANIEIEVGDKSVRALIPMLRKELEDYGAW